MTNIETPKPTEPPAPVVINPPQGAIDLRSQLQVIPPGVNPWLNLMVYGEAGVGKTYFSGTAADHEDTGPVLILDVEGGMTTLAGKNDVDVKPVRNMKQVQDLYNLIYPTVKDGAILYKTIVIDSLSELADLDMREIMKREHDQKPDKIEKDVATQAAWGKCRIHIRDIIRAFRDLPCNVILIAGMGKSQEEGQPVQYYPAFAGKLRHEVPGFVDIVGFFSADVGPNGEVVRKLQVQGTRKVVAKDRTGAFNRVILDPSVPKMWDILHGSQSTVTEGENK